jgi:hypothetical protein
MTTQIPQPHLKQLDINEQFIDYRNIFRESARNNIYSVYKNLRTTLSI